ncbi:MAG: asparagine synthase (glutamine-hydrolyzing) [Bacteroidales bacterium]|nr:asparagine synthase (glutamine-hydrolyzing) [Bacteroidales bacterium]
MCGIAGFISNNCTKDDLFRMGDTLIHRGPDETGCFYSKNVGLISKRLSIVDLENGEQPSFNETKSITVIFNGEIYNFAKLRKELSAKGHNISYNSVTAVLPHMYEEYGTAMFERLSGQFAIAIYDISCEKLILARDKMGIIPLYCSFANGEFFFGSEIKALLAGGRIKKELNITALCDVFTFWSPQCDRTIFSGVASLLPGEFWEFQNNVIKKEKYYTLKFKKEDKNLDFESNSEKIEALLCNAIQKGLIGDVKISTYLSGGLDSSLITSIIAGKFNSSVEAFSVGFEDDRLDESKYQKLVCDRLGIKHNKIIYKNSDMPGLIKEIIRHTETPLLRAGPIPLFKLSELVNKNNVKVVLSGEGADEFFGGYDIFKEVKIRSYLKKHPDSAMRKLLLKSVNIFSGSAVQSAPAGGLNYFYMHNGNDIFDSHYTRWRQFSFFEHFFSDNVGAELKDFRYKNYRELLKLDCEQDIEDFTDIQRSQYFEIKTFLSQYLLSSQGDRVSMANSVEVRFPFLDDELVEYCLSLNDRFKIRGLNEKYILKKIAAKYLPGELVNRKKFPYRSFPDFQNIIGDSYLKYMLSEEAIRRYDIFNSIKIDRFITAIAAKSFLSERETMLLMGVLTTQVLCDVFDVCHA